jgi:hypothetical protein
LEILAGSYRHSEALHRTEFAELNRAGNHRRERNELWEELFVVWGTLIGKKIQPRKRGVSEFVRIASENISFAAGQRRSQVVSFWDDDTGRKHRIKAKIANGCF